MHSKSEMFSHSEHININGGHIHNANNIYNINIGRTYNSSQQWPTEVWLYDNSVDTTGLILKRTRTTEPKAMSRPSIPLVNAVGRSFAGEVDSSHTQHIGGDKVPGVDQATGGAWEAVGPMGWSKIWRTRHPRAISYIADVLNQRMNIGPVGSEEINVIET